MDIISLFAGCGGLDIGFRNAGFNIVWANEKDPSIWATYEYNHPDTILDRRNISKIPISEIPDCFGVIGGPPCQSWSDAGNGNGAKDARGRLFYDFIRVIRLKKPLFFVAENVPGMLNDKHKNSLNNIKGLFKRAGYNCSIEILNSADYSVPQNRKRLFFVGFREELDFEFVFPKKLGKIKNVESVIYDLKNNALQSKEFNRSNKESCLIPNHEYWIGTYSYIFMSRNRVLNWKSPSYTIQASGRQMALHPQAPKMKKIKKDVMGFSKTKLALYRRLSIRECARIQTFPDNFIFIYDNLKHGYKMVGNAVPVKLSEVLARKIIRDINKLDLTNYNLVQGGFCKVNEEIKKITKKAVGFLTH